MAVFGIKLFWYDQYDFESAVFAVADTHCSIMAFYNLFHNKQSQAMPLLGCIGVADHIMGCLV